MKENRKRKAIFLSAQKIYFIKTLLSKINIIFNLLSITLNYFYFSRLTTGIKNSTLSKLGGKLKFIIIDFITETGDAK